MNGVTDLDDHVAEILRRSKKPVILVANKVDSNDWIYNVPNSTSSVSETRLRYRLPTVPAPATFLTRL